jgi:hypothetical protein
MLRLFRRCARVFTGKHADNTDATPHAWDLTFHLVDVFSKAGAYETARVEHPRFDGSRGSRGSRVERRPC